MSSPIILSTLNATYFHCAFGLRYLYANLNELQKKASIVEFTTAQKPQDIAESLLRLDPKIVGFGVYIWNTRQTQQVVAILKKIRPSLIIVLGGPEVSYEWLGQPICELADYTIRGEADFLFYEFCRAYFDDGKLPETKFISGPLPEISQIASPYSFYNDEDIRNRVIYVEASRGCPYRCEFCLSSLDKSVRSFRLPEFLADCEHLIERGARQFKFVDRTFNLSLATSSQIMNFFLERIDRGLFLHFEMVPDRLPEELRTLIQKFPEGSLQFEIGIQTWDPGVAKNVSRRQDYAKVKENFAFLSNESTAHLHADLIVGLPGETLESFAIGFDAVVGLGPHEVQVGILKRLKGTPIIRHDAEFEMAYQDEPPFNILQTKTMSFETIQALTRFAKFWELYANRGNFKNTMGQIKAVAGQRENASLFWEFFEFSAYLSQRHPQNYGVALLSLVESAWLYLTEVRSADVDAARDALVKDYTGYVKRDIPVFLRRENERARTREISASLLADHKNGNGKRQERHRLNSEVAARV